MRLGSDHSTRVLPLVLVMRLGSMALLLIRMMALSLPCTAPSTLSLTVTLRSMLLLLLLLLLITLLMMSPRISRLRLRWVLVVPGMLSVRTLLLLILVILAPCTEDRLHDLENPQDDSRHGKLALDL